MNSRDHIVRTKIIMRYQLGKTPLAIANEMLLSVDDVKAVIRDMPFPDMHKKGEKDEQRRA